MHAVPEQQPPMLVHTWPLGHVPSSLLASASKQLLRQTLPREVCAQTWVSEQFGAPGSELHPGSDEMLTVSTRMAARMSRVLMV